MAPDPPKVLISYSNDSPEHERRVVALANELRTRSGVDAWIDRYRPDPDDWISWMWDHIEQDDGVLLVFTKTYVRRFLSKEASVKGLGLTFEDVIISQAMYESGIHNAKFRAVVFREEDKGCIPLEPRRVNRYRVDTPESYQKLLRWLHDKPEVELPPIGPKPEFSPPLPLGPLHGVSDLPRHYSPRQGELAVLRQKLLAGDESAAITGIGGIGKTVLTSALAHEPEVRQAFPDGIYWLTIGQTLCTFKSHTRLETRSYLARVTERFGYGTWRKGKLLPLSTVDGAILSCAVVTRDGFGHLHSCSLSKRRNEAFFQAKQSLRYFSSNRLTQGTNCRVTKQRARRFHQLCSR